MHLSKTLLLILCMSFFAGILQANEAASVSKEPIAFLSDSTGMAPFTSRVTSSDLTEFAASRGGGGGMGIVTITGAAMALGGAAMWISGIPMVWFSGLGLGYWDDPSGKYQVYFLNDNNMWGFAGLYTGIAFIVTGGILFVAGTILLLVGVLGGGGKRASLFHKIDAETKTESIGISIKL